MVLIALTLATCMQETEHFQIEIPETGINHEILVFHRDKANSKSKPALLIGFDGYGINERQMKTLVGLELDHPYVYLAPRGFHQLEDGIHGWFKIDIVENRPVYGEQELFRAAESIAKMIPQLVELTNADESNVFTIGN